MSPQRLADFTNQLTDDGRLDATAVSEITNRLFVNGTVNRDATNLLFDVSVAVKNSQTQVSRQGLFLALPASRLLEGPPSSGAPDSAAGDWLLSQIGNGQGAAVAALPANSKKSALRVVGHLQERLV